jgi:hypothetical protein
MGGIFAGGWRVFQASKWSWQPLYARPELSLDIFWLKGMQQGCEVIRYLLTVIWTTTLCASLRRDHLRSHASAWQARSLEDSANRKQMSAIPPTCKASIYAKATT